MKLRDLGLTQPLRHQRIMLGLGVCLRLCVLCVCVWRVRMCVFVQVYIGNACAAV